MNENEAGVDLVLIETSLFFLCKFLLISMTKTSLPWEKEGGLYHNKVNTVLASLSLKGLGPVVQKPINTNTQIKN